jgi:monoterpene epsilon-lactone hydrolase
MPPVRIHVGDDEVLLDDSVRYAERAVTASVDVGFDVWMEMPHGFAGARSWPQKTSTTAGGAVTAYRRNRWISSK